MNKGGLMLPDNNKPSAADTPPTAPFPPLTPLAPTTLSARSKQLLNNFATKINPRDLEHTTQANMTVLGQQPEDKLENNSSPPDDSDEDSTNKRSRLNGSSPYKIPQTHATKISEQDKTSLV